MALKLSEEHKKKIGLANSIALKGRKVAEDVKVKIRKTNLRLGRRPPRYV